jgi:protein tyrosine/serine phosphatase
MQRQISLEGCLNFRDLGGYPTASGGRVRWRRVFRSDALHGVTPNDVACLRAIGITAVIDLRSTAELRADGDGPLQREGIAHHHVPLFDGKTVWPVERPATVTLSDRYWLLAEYAKDKIATVLSKLAASAGPAVYHCAAGKDRTGVVSAVLLGVLDVPDEVIVADYVATRENLDAIVAKLQTMESYKAVLSALPEDTLHAEAETMIALLERIRTEYGGMRAYAQAAGVTPDALETLRCRLVEPA